MNKLTVKLIIALTLFSLTFQAYGEEVSCLPKEGIYYHAFTSKQKIITEFKNSNKQDLKKNIDANLFNDNLEQLSRDNIFEFSSAIHMDYLVKQINLYCQGNLFQSLSEVVSKKCFANLGLIELKLMSIEMEYEQNPKDQLYNVCPEQEFNIETPYVSAADRG